MSRAGLAVCVLCFAVEAYAQLATTTSLVGSITDDSGALVPAVNVTGVNEATHDTYNGVTNAQGFYELQFVHIGTYTITAAKSGFQTIRKTGIPVDINQVVRTDFTLRVGEVSQTITVGADAAPIATDEASLSEIIGQRAAADLPLNGRDALQLAVTTPGVIHGLKSPHGNTASTTGGGEDFIGAGTREITNSVPLDGASIVTNLVTQVTFRPSVDAIQEFQIQTGTYSAQYGSYVGVHINLVTKSGGNQLHGAVWEFLRNSDLDARNFFELPSMPKAPFRQNQFGFEVGGR
jgi:Carboxypeptidase regulatory-like domain